MICLIWCDRKACPGYAVFKETTSLSWSQYSLILRKRVRVDLARQCVALCYVQSNKFNTSLLVRKHPPPKNITNTNLYVPTIVACWFWIWKLSSRNSRAFDSALWIYIYFGFNHSPFSRLVKTYECVIILKILFGSALTHT